MLEELHKKVEQKTSVLHAETSALEAEKQSLSRLASALHEQLSHFKTLDLAAATLNHSDVSVKDPAFFQVLAKVDDALKFVRSHPGYLAAPQYLQRFGQLQQRGLMLIREHVSAQLRAAAEHSVLKMAGKGGGADSLAYIEFRAVAPALRPYCAELERRATGDLALLQESYLAARRVVLLPCVRTNLATLGALDLARAAAEGASYLGSLGQMETQLFHAFFDREGPGLSKLLAELADLWAGELGPHIVACRSVSVLCRLLASLRTYAAASTAGQSHHLHSTTVAARPQAWHVAVAGAAQERLVFLVQVSLRENLLDDGEILGPADALDYPGRLSREGSDRWGRVQRALLLMRHLKVMSCLFYFIFFFLSFQAIINS